MTPDRKFDPQLIHMRSSSLLHRANDHGRKDRSANLRDGVIRRENVSDRTATNHPPES